jgi:hypothetical protein
MRLAEINKKMAKMRSEVNAIRLQLSKINSEYDRLKLLGRQVEIEHFKNWLYKDQLIDVENYMWLSGVETTKDQKNTKHPHFRKGEQIQVLKINPKSVVIKCIKGLLQDRTFRIDIDIFHQYLMSDVDINMQFKKWLVRTESFGELELD